MSSAYEAMAKGSRSDSDNERSSGWNREKQGVDPERAKRLERGFRSEGDVSRWLNNAYKSLAGDSSQPKGMPDSSRQ